MYVCHSHIQTAKQLKLICKSVVVVAAGRGGGGVVAVEVVVMPCSLKFAHITGDATYIAEESTCPKQAGDSALTTWSNDDKGTKTA